VESGRALPGSPASPYRSADSLRAKKFAEDAEHRRAAQRSAVPSACSTATLTFAGLSPAQVDEATITV